MFLNIINSINAISELESVISKTIPEIKKPIYELAIGEYRRYKTALGRARTEPGFTNKDDFLNQYIQTNVEGLPQEQANKKKSIIKESLEMCSSIKNYLTQSARIQAINDLSQIKWYTFRKQKIIDNATKLIHKYDNIEQQLMNPEVNMLNELRRNLNNLTEQTFKSKKLWKSYLNLVPRTTDKESKVQMAIRYAKHIPVIFSESLGKKVKITDENGQEHEILPLQNEIRETYNTIKNNRSIKKRVDDEFWTALQ